MFEIMKKINSVILGLIAILINFACSKSDHLKKDLEIDTNLPELVDVRYEVKINHPELYNLCVSYTYGETYFDFVSQGYINNGFIRSEVDLDLSSWSYEKTMKKGAILYIAANVVTKENISAIEPSSITVNIFIDEELIKSETRLIYAACEYIYGALEQNNSYYMYTN